MQGATTDGGAQMVGRESELAVLEDFLDGRHPQRALLLRGGPGIGKTTLWEAGIETARRRGTRVLSARPSEAEARLSLAALSDLLEGVDAKFLSALPPPRRHALEVALLRADPQGPAPEPRAIAAGLLDVLRELAAREPLLVAVDDVHWLDAPSAEALAFTARRLHDDRVTFLLTARPGTSSAFDRALEPAGLKRKEVGALSLGATRRLLGQRLGLSLPRRALRQIFEATHGNPLFALEVARSLVERGTPEIGEVIPVPEMVEDLLGVRVAHVPEPVRKVLLAVALSGDLRLSQLAVFADPTAVDDAFDAGLLVADGERLRPSHPLLAAAARAQSHASQRRALHLELADVVDDEELRARHLALAATGPDAELATTVAAAAALAVARGASEDAVELAEHALRLTSPESVERAHRLLSLAEYLMVAGEPQRATDLLAPEADTLPPGWARARAHLLLADSRFAISHVDEYGSHLDRALADSDSDAGLHATVMARKVRYAAVARVERIAEAEAWALAALPDARAAGGEVECEVLHGLAWARVMRGRPIDDLRQRFQAIADDAFHIFRSLDRVASDRLALRGDIDQAREIFTRLLAAADERGEALSYATLRLQLVEVELRAGEWETASHLLDEWDRPPDRELLGAAAYERCQALLAAGVGDPDEAERWAADSIARSEALGLRWNLLEALRARGLAALFVNDPERAAESLRVVWDHTEREGVEEPAMFPVAPDLVEALTEIGALDEALAVTDRLSELAGQQEHPWALATAKRCRAMVQLAADDGDDVAGSELAEAAVAYAEMGLRFDRARTLLVLGRLERRRRRWGAARRCLEQAAAAFEEIGSLGWAEQARSELARVGARRPRAAGELTPAERRVVELAADGLSNKEIARTLFVSVHTIEAHLSHAYAKLDVRSRSQLASRLSASA